MSIPIIAPVSGSKPVGRSKFGPRDTTGLPSGATNNHEGVDIGRGTLGPNPIVRSPVSGTVVHVQRATVNARGLYVDIKDAKGSIHRLQHLKSIAKTIKTGGKIRIGRKIGRMGNSSTLKNMAEHLHYEVHVSGKPVDPEKYFADNGQPNIHLRPGEGVVMTPKFNSRHLQLKLYDDDRKTVVKRRNAKYKYKNVLSTWKTWTVLRSGRFVATARLKKAKG